MEGKNKYGEKTVTPNNNINKYIIHNSIERVT